MTGDKIWQLADSFRWNVSIYPVHDRQNIADLILAT